jgi:inositol-phosphate phosphatase / L-galactose 1-phosphate phosphatase / histidinol-phosphatase
VYDFAALAPVVNGAGGVLCDWRGRDLTIDSDGAVLGCGDRRLLQAALDALHRD